MHLEVQETRCTQKSRRLDALRSAGDQMHLSAGDQMHLEVQETRCTYRSAQFSALASQHYKDSLGQYEDKNDAQRDKRNCKQH